MSEDLPATVPPTTRFPDEPPPRAVEPEGPEGDARMSIVEHLKELRIRLLRAAIALAVGFFLAYAIDNQIFNALTYPIREVSHGKVLLIGTGVGEAFFTKLKVALIAGLFIASPAVFYEIWKFIAPGLYNTERKLARPFVIFATLFFVAGGYFCWAVVFRIGYAFFLSEYASIGVTPTIRISEYLAFSTKLLLAFGITFEMPIFAYFLTQLGIIDYKMMISYVRYAIVAIVIVAAALTPPDLISQFLLSIPLLLLYALSIGVAYVFRKRETVALSAAEDGSSTT